MILLQVFAALGVVAVVGALLALIARAGDARFADRVDRLRRVTPYEPPDNARPGDFDELGRPW